MRRGHYHLHEAREGFTSIVHTASGEIMHSRSAPLDEADKLYVQQSRLPELLATDSKIPLVVWDVGLGGAANAIAAIHAAESVAAHGPVRPLNLISFESDLDPLHMVIDHPDRFPYASHPAITALLTHGEWCNSPKQNISWLLVHGKFPQTLSPSIPSPDIIFYDLFSAKTHADAWTLATFQMIRAACGLRGTQLFTYTVSTAARSAMLGGGFFVAAGCGTGAKSETTIAINPVVDPTMQMANIPNLLDATWLAKWERSTAKFPSDLPAAQRDQFSQSLRNHPQFAEVARRKSITARAE